jgi:hypothetical protein
VGTSEATVTEGTVSAGTFSTSSNNSNLSALTDQQIGPYATFSGSTASGVRFDLSSSKACDFAQVYLSGTISGHTLRIYGSDTAGSGYTEVTSTTIVKQEWNLLSLSGTYRYWVFQAEKATVNLQIHEIILGESLVPAVKYSLGSKIDPMPLVRMFESYSGVEYVNQYGATKTRFEFTWDNISDSLKSDLETLRTNVESKHFIYYDDKEYYVSLDGLNFTEIASGRWSTTMTMTT